MRIEDSRNRGIGRRPPPSTGPRAPGPEGSAVHPGSDAILWTPWRAWVTETPAETGWDIVFTPQALAGVFDHFLSGEGGVGGTLTGVRRRCPRSGRRWVRVDRAIRARTPLPDGSSVMALESALFGSGEPPGDDREVVGWYHSHGQLGAYLTEAEHWFHDRRFVEPWQFALILVARSEPVGGIFQQPALTLPRGRKYVGFYELPAGRRADGSLDTLIRWRNYRTDARVTPADAGSVRALAASASDEPPTPDEAAPPDEPPTPDEAPPPDEMGPGEEVRPPETASVPEESEGERPRRATVVVPGERRANRRRARTVLAAAVIAVALGAGGTAAWWLTRPAGGESGDSAVFAAPGADLESPADEPPTDEAGRADPAAGTDTAGRADTASPPLGRPDPDRPRPPPESR